MTFSIFTAKYVTLWSVVKMISPSERASESESIDYDNCSSSDDSLGTDGEHNVTETLYARFISQMIDFAKMWIHHCTLWLSSQSVTSRQTQPATTDCQQWFVDTLFLMI